MSAVQDSELKDKKKKKAIKKGQKKKKKKVVKYHRGRLLYCIVSF